MKLERLKFSAWMKSDLFSSAVIKAGSTGHQGVGGECVGEEPAAEQPGPIRVSWQAAPSISGVAVCPWKLGGMGWLGQKPRDSETGIPFPSPTLPSINVAWLLSHRVSSVSEAFAPVSIGSCLSPQGSSSGGPVPSSLAQLGTFRKSSRWKAVDQDRAPLEGTKAGPGSALALRRMGHRENGPMGTPLGRDPAIFIPTPVGT